MPYVYAGSRLVYVANWNQTGLIVWTYGVSDVLAQVANDLSNQYQLRVERSDVKAPSVAVGSLTETITLYLYSGIDRNDVTDIIGNVDDAFARYGSRPDSSGVTTITPPSGTPQGTGAPGPAPQPSDTTPSWWSSLTSSLEAGSVGFILGGLVIAAVVIAVIVKGETS